MNGRAYGAVFTPKETEAMTMEIKRQIAELNGKNKTNLEAFVLWQLHEQLGFGVKRLDNFCRKLRHKLRNLKNFPKKNLPIMLKNLPK